MDKRLVLEAAKSRAEHKSRVKLDVPYEIRRARRDLALFFEDALKQNQAPKVVGRKLQLNNGKTYKLHYNHNNKADLVLAHSGM
jgi:hypothetical protein